MFNDIPPLILQRMQELELRDSEEQKYVPEPHKSEVPSKRSLLKNENKAVKLHQISPETGRFINLIAQSAPPNGQWLEIGTSAGYSTLWLSLACKKFNTTITTFELNEKKIQLAKETFSCTLTEQYINLIQGNVLDYLHNYKDISFCFLDTEKKIYSQCYDIVVENMVKGAWLLADNVISHQRFLKTMLKNTFEDSRLDSVIVPIGKGVLMCRKI